MAKSMTLLAPACAGFLLLSAGMTRADGLADLNAALARLSGPAEINGVIDASTWTLQGEDDEAEETRGQASVAIEDNEHGMQVLYSKELLARLETEERAKEADANSKTPTLSALNDLDTSDLRPMLYAAGSLQRRLEKAVYKSEKMDSHNGNPARLLSFELPIDKLSEKDRKYVKKFEGSLNVWIAADGTPLASRMHWAMQGRAFVFISFESSGDEDSLYSLVGERLVATRNESKSSSSGAGEKQQRKVTKNLQLQSGDVLGKL